MICSPIKLDSELDKIRDIFINNGYPLDLIDDCINKKVADFKSLKPFGPLKCPVYLKLPWIGDNATKITKQIVKSITNCFYAVSLRLVYTVRPAFPPFCKDSLPYVLSSNIVYSFSCQCDAGYVGRTSLHLRTRINQHVPSKIRQGRVGSMNLPCSTTLDSAIGQHLVDNPCCANQYKIEWFEVLHRADSKNHLRILESVSIAFRKPSLCRQKDTVKALNLFGKI